MSTTRRSTSGKPDFVHARRRWYDHLFSGAKRFLLITAIPAAGFGAYKASVELLGLSFLSGEAAAAKYAERRDVESLRDLELEHYQLLKRDLEATNAELKTISEFLLYGRRP